MQEELPRPGKTTNLAGATSDVDKGILIYNKESVKHVLHHATHFHHRRINLPAIPFYQHSSKASLRICKLPFTG